MQERKSFRKDHPPGFVAKPQTKADGDADLMVWYCGIPGKKGTIWEGGFFPLKIFFTDDYPQTAPKLTFPKGFFHPNIYDSGRVCLSIINEEADGTGWKPSVTIKQVRDIGMDGRTGGLTEHY
jgi:ubiquitin-conjugating enzyme E2 I